MNTKICEVDGCGRTNISHPNRVGYNKNANMILCDKHKLQFKRHGYDIATNKIKIQYNGDFIFSDCEIE